MPYFTPKQNLLIDQLSGISRPRKTAPDPRTALPFGQKILTNPIVSKVIDTLSGGVSLPEAEKYSKKQIQNLQNLQNLPSVIPALSPLTPLAEQEKALESLSTPLETISRVPSALQKMMFPTPGESRPESAIKALIRPDLMPSGYLGGEFSKLMPPPPIGKEISMVSPRVLIPGLMGAAGELASYELGLGTIFSRLAKGYHQAELRGAKNKMNELLDEAVPTAFKWAESKGLYPKDWNLSDKLGRTRLKLKETFESDPRIGDLIMKEQTPSKILFGWLKSEKGTAEIPSEIPKPKEIIPEITAGIKNIIPKVKGGVPSGEIKKEGAEETSLLKKEIPGIEAGKAGAEPALFINVPTPKEILETISNKKVTITQQAINFAKKHMENKDEAEKIINQKAQELSKRREEIKSIPKEKRTDLENTELEDSQQTSQFFTEAKEALTGKLTEERVAKAYAKIKELNEFDQPKNIPVLKNTGEAESYGESIRADRGRIEDLKKAEQIARNENEELRKIPPEQQTDEQMQQALTSNFKAQKLKEALDVALGRKSLREEKDLQPASPVNPPVEPPKTTFEQPEPGGLEEPEPIKPSKQPSIEEQSEMEIETLNYTGGQHPLEKAMKEIGKIKIGKESEEYQEIPLRFKSKEGKPIDEVKQELEELGIFFESDSELRQALRNLGEKQQRFLLSPEVQTYLKTKANVEALGKKLESKISPAAYKRIIYSNVGLKFKETPHISTKEKMFKYVLKQREIAGRKGEVVGREQIRDKIRMQKSQERAEREAAQRFTPEQRKELYQAAYSKGLIIEKADHKHKDRLAPILSHYKNASFGEVKNYIAQLQGSQDNPSPKILKLYGDINKDAEAMELINKMSAGWVDINKVETGTLDQIRQAEKVSGLDSWDDNNILTQNIFDIISGADFERFKRFEKEKKELHDFVGLLADTKASADLMRKFEMKEELTEKEQKAVDFLRKKYDNLFEEANAVRQKLGKPLIQYRKDYMTHIREYNLLTSFFKGDIRQMNSITTAQLDAIRKGDFTKGNMKFNQFALKRTGPKTKYDAVGNYEKYLETLLYEIYMTPAVAHARKFSEYALLRLPNYYKATTALLDRLAGKPSSYDRTPLAQAVFSNNVIKWLRKQIAKNALIGNISFNAINVSNITTNVGELGNYSLKGLKGFLGDKELRHLAFEKSSMLQSRKSQFDADVKAVNVFNIDSLDKLTALEKSKVARKQIQYIVEGMTRMIEYNNVGSTWVGAYLKAVEKLKFSQDKAFKYADAIAKRTQVGYRAYELPEIMASDMGKTLAQFQTWTFNAMNHLIYDLKFGNIPNQILTPFSKDNKPTDVEYRKFFLLLAVALLINEAYKKSGLREPTSITSVAPRISFPAGRIISAAGTLGRAGFRKAGIEEVLGQEISRPKKETTERAVRTLVTTALPYGGTQVARFAEGRVLPDRSKYQTKDIINLYKQSILENDKEKESRADELSKRLGLSIKRMKLKAEQKIKRGESGSLSRIEENLHSKSEENFKEELNKMIKFGKLSIKGANRVNSLRQKRLKDEKKIEREIKEQANPKNRISPEIWEKIEALSK